MKDRKASGPDGIPNEAAIENNVGAFVDIYKSCLAEGTFPPIWKRQRLVLTPKKGKPNEDPSSYQLGKRVLATRLEKALTNAGGFSPNQYGFCRLK